MKIPDNSYAFIDGSYNPEKKVYGCGGYLVDHRNNVHVFQYRGYDPKLAKMRNVSGEIIGAILAIQLALRLKMKKLVIFHDYKGLSCWPAGLWRCHNNFTRDYKKFIKDVIESGFNVEFRHVKAHSNLAEHDKAHCLAWDIVHQ